jgi:hypothetical protein
MDWIGLDWICIDIGLQYFGTWFEIVMFNILIYMEFFEKSYILFPKHIL